METMDRKRPRKLGLNARLLSTRRLGCSVVGDASCSSYSVCAIQNTSERVSFPWENSPRKPKGTESYCNPQDGGTPRLNQPPSHGLLSREASDTGVDDANDAFHAQGDGSCVGIDTRDDIFSDAIPAFSLSEALDHVQKKSENVHSEKNEGLRLKRAECSGYQSPTYMINRFLPDATALAASSAEYFYRNFEDKDCDTCGSYSECYLRHSYASSPKGFGLEVLFPRRLKHKICAIERPVLTCSTNLHKHQRSSKQKKPGSSTNIPCTNVKENI